MQYTPEKAHAMNDSTSNGLYVACKYDLSSSIAIKHICMKLGTTPVDLARLHTTICYSRKPPSKSIEYASWNLYNKQVVTAKGLHVFKGQDGKNILVLLLESDFLQQQHRQFMQDYDLSYDFPEYLPHISLSYDYHSETAPELPLDVDLNLTVKLMYTEPLQLSWNKTFNE